MNELKNNCVGKVRIGVVGGHRGESMIDYARKADNAVLVAICDFNEDVLEKQREICGKDVTYYTDFEDFLKHPMDAVVLANYATEHTPLAIKALNAGKHVLSECLPSQTLAEAIELIEAVERTGLVYSYAENYCYKDNTFEMWRRYKNGDIGEITSANCEYIHDCAECWLDITYGEKDHWRNHIYPTFYCTHSLGPILMSSNRRPVQVVGFENPPIDEFYKLGHSGGHASGIEMVTLDNGAIVRSIHGPLKREPSHTTYEIYGTKGYIGSSSEAEITVYREGETTCNGETEKYKPESFVAVEQKKACGMTSHGGSDFYSTYLFVEKILGNPDGKWAIDVYTAVDMGICGILAYRSVLNGNQPVKVPDFRNKDERDAYRNDRACTDPMVAGDQLIPCSSYGEKPLSDAAANDLKKQWKDKSGQ